MCVTSTAKRRRKQARQGKRARRFKMKAERENNRLLRTKK